MRARLWPPAAVSFGALLLLSTLFAWLISREASRIHEHTKTAQQIYQTGVAKLRINPESGPGSVVTRFAKPA
jgi:hypothetical protein